MTDPLTKDEQTYIDEARRNLANPHTNGSWALDAKSWLPVIDRLCAEVTRLREVMALVRLLTLKEAT